MDISVGDLLEPGDHPEQCRFPASGRTDEDDELAVPDLQIDAVDDLGGAEPLDYAL
jgi:hypothetical protein